jgi:predicted nuclease of predicted toxin-antitoxin system
MKRLLDQGLPRSAADLLRLAGIDAIHVGEVGFAAAADESILELGRVQHRTVVTLDSDFHASLALHASVSPSVIRIRIEGLRGAELTSLLQTVLIHCDDPEKGAAVVIQLGRIRVRHLPLHTS